MEEEGNDDTKYEDPCEQESSEEPAPKVVPMPKPKKKFIEKSESEEEDAGDDYSPINKRSKIAQTSRGGRNKTANKQQAGHHRVDESRLTSSKSKPNYNTL